MVFLYARQIPLNSLADAKNTFSSWHNCMAKTYCNGGRRSGGHQRMKSESTPISRPAPAPSNANPYAQAHAAAPPAPPIPQYRPPAAAPAPLNQQYRSHAAPSFAPAPAQERPQFATFDSPSKPVNEDALPAMPSWGDARERHVEVKEEPMPQKQGDMEMDQLDRNGSVPNTSTAGMAAGPRRSPVPARSPVSAVDDYGYNQGYEREPLVGAAPYRSPHDSPAPYNNGRPYAQQDDYRPYAQQYDHYDHYDHYDQQSTYTSIPPSYRSSPPPLSQGYNNNNINININNNNNNSSSSTIPPYNGAAPPPPARSHSPGYPYPKAPTAEMPPTPADPAAQPLTAYPGQRSYTPQQSQSQSQPSFPSPTPYHPFHPPHNTAPHPSGLAN
ncbi:hypothetical protein ACEQ8H_003114 [Pleosporales sp. CAS-2024a]